MEAVEHITAKGSRICTGNQFIAILMIEFDWSVLENLGKFENFQKE